MLFLAVTLVLVAAIALANAAFTLKLVRELRDLDDRFTKATGGAGGRVYPVGRPVEEFSAVTVDGEPVSRDALSGWTLVGFVSPGCPPCHKRLPEFLAAARVVGRERTLAVVAGEESSQGLVEQLAPAARVVTAHPGDGVVEAFGVEGFPTFVLVDPAGTVALAGHAEDLVATLSTASA